MSVEIKKIKRIFESFNKLNILIVGDSILDAYMWGDVDRISPEAPIPVVSVNKKENRLGGAANVTLNIKALGANPILCSVLGGDDKQAIFARQMADNNLEISGLIIDNNRKTTVKTRIFGHNQQLLRIDEEILERISKKTEKELINRIKSIISKTVIDAVIIADYDKGVVTPALIREVAEMANSKNIPVAADPKIKNFNQYKNINLFKPNLKELAEGLKTELVKGDFENIKATAKLHRESKNIRYILVTLSEQGVLLGSEETNEVISAEAHQVSDVSGAGDTVISVASACMAANVPPLDMAIIANLAGSLVCEKVGVSPLDKEQLLSETCNIYSKIRKAKTV